MPNVGIGTNTPSSKLQVDDTNTTTTNRTTSGVSLTVNVASSQAPTIKNVGISSQISSGTSNSSAVGKTIGVDVYVGHDWGNSVVDSVIGGQFLAHKNTGGAATNVKGVVAEVGSYSGGTTATQAAIETFSENSAGTVTDQYGLRVRDLAATGGTIVNRYGVHIGAFSGSATTKDFAIYQVGTSQNNYFAGKVGLGTTTPTAMLDVASGNGTGILLGAEVNSTNRGDNNIKVGRIGVPHYSNSEEPMALLMGDAGITRNEVYLGGGSTVMNTATQIRFFTAANKTTLLGTERMTIEDNGYVGVGNTAPSARLHVGDSSVTGGTTIAKFETATGVCSVTPNTGMSCSSDERLKKNFALVDGDQVLETLMQIQAYTYQMNQDPSGQRYTGYKAQEIQKIEPSFVRQDKQTGLLEVYYTNFIPWLTEAIKSVYSQVLGLDREVASLKTDLANSQRQIQSLEQQNRDIKAYLCGKDPAAPICR